MAGRFKSDLGNKGSLEQHLSILTMSDFVSSVCKHKAAPWYLPESAFQRVNRNYPKVTSHSVLLHTKLAPNDNDFI